MSADRDPEASRGFAPRRLSRRKLLTTASAGVLSVGALSTPTNAARVRQKLPFDIRDLVPGSDQDNECIQCTYDAINRMVFLIGDMQFRNLFPMSMGELLPAVMPRIQPMAQLGLIDDPQLVQDLGTQLQKMAPDQTIKNFFTLPRSQVPGAIITILIGLRRVGINIPLPIASGLSMTVQRRRKQAMTRLLRSAGDVTFLDLFTRPRDDVSRDALVAISFARSAELFGWWDNDRCCDAGGGAVEGTDVCVTFTNTWCNITPSGTCSPSSTPCPGDNPNRAG